jgi:hypothetical protein
MEVTPMPDSPLPPHIVIEAVLDATLVELGGEPLDGSGFEEERPVDLDAEPAEEGLE